MRHIVYSCAMSLDGYIAGPNGEYNWITMDPEVDFEAMAARFDTWFIGRKTYEAMRRMGSEVKTSPGSAIVVFSRTLTPAEHPHVTVTSDAEGAAASLRRQPGKDIWLFGGGELFRSLLAAGLVDRVELAVIPVLLGGGIPLLPAPAAGTKLQLRAQRVYAKTGTIGLEYDVVR